MTGSLKVKIELTTISKIMLYVSLKLKSRAIAKFAIDHLKTKTTFVNQ